MPLSSGDKLAHYQIRALLGRGGMGEVYRAFDENLGRDVAIKVLHDEVARDTERLARFEREARLLASLNHTGIATLHGLERDGETPLLVMELVEGETLADRIARGPIPTEEALSLFAQIAEALEAAHEKGIVHRDLKPSNIKVTPEGKIKILDFGLAKLAEPETGPVPTTSISPTLTRGTELGVILGTAAYMSPEQARGSAVDRRTDIWAFGCCLYEALTGRRVFDEASVTDTLAAVIKTEPDWSRLPVSLPRRVRDLLERCLRKDAFWRLREIGDARLAIAEAGAPDEDRVKRTRPAPALVLLSLLAGVLAGAAGTALLVGGRSPTPRHTYHFTIPTPISSRNTLGTRLALSRDGSSLLVREDDAVTVRRLDRPDHRALEGTRMASFPAFSPDGKWIVFGQDGELKKQRLDGGSATSLGPVTELHGAHWLIEDSIVFADRTGLKRISASGGAAVFLLEADGLGSPHVLPGGRAVVLSSPLERTSGVEVLILATGERRTILENATSPRYVPSGHLLFERDGSLLAVSFDADRLEASGAPFVILNGVYQNPWNRRADYDVAADGTLVYLGPGGLEGTVSLSWVQRGGEEQPAVDGSRPYAAPPRISPAGTELAITILAPPDVWVVDLARGSHRRLTHAPRFGLRPIWSGDSKRVYFGSFDDDGRLATFWRNADGSGDVALLTSGDYRIPESTTSDGRVLIFRQGRPDGNTDIGLLRLDDPTEPEMILTTRFDEHSVAISPDDRLLAFVSDESGQEEVYATPFPDVGSRFPVSTNGGTEPVWSKDGTEIFYREGTKLMAVRREPGALPRFGAPTVVLEDAEYEPLDFQLGGTAWGGASYDVATDGRFLMMRRGTSPETEIHVIVNALGAILP